MHIEYIGLVMLSMGVSVGKHNSVIESIKQSITKSTSPV